MGIVTGQKKPLVIPGESDTVEIRRLGWKQLDDISDIASAATLERVKQMGGDMIAAMRSAVTDAAQTERDGFADYDQGALLREGIVSWTYEAPLPDGVDQLEPKTAEFIARAIYEFSIGARTEAERGEGISPST